MLSRSSRVAGWKDSAPIVSAISRSAGVIWVPTQAGSSMAADRSGKSRAGRMALPKARRHGKVLTVLAKHG